LLLECTGVTTASGGVPTNPSEVRAREQGENVDDDEILDLNDGQRVGDGVDNSIRSTLNGPDNSCINSTRRRGRHLGSKSSSAEKRLRRLGANDIDASASSIAESQAAFARSYSEA
jgi:hypothetical protein